MITINPRVELDEFLLGEVLKHQPAREHLLIIPLENVLADKAYPTIISALHAAEKEKPSSVLLHCYGEAPVIEFYKIAASIIRVWGINKIAAADHGIAFPGAASESHYTHLQFQLLGFEKYSKIKDLTPAASRKYLYCSLNRTARTDRVKFVAELIKRNLLSKGLVSCGVGGDPYDFQATLGPELARHFPVILDGPLIGRHDSTFLRIPAGVAEAVINVVGEGIVSQHHDLDRPDDRILITEKTVKAYKLHQLPLWIGPYEFVHTQRQLGFDVFDDFIDHSYDLIYDPGQRILAVAAELQRLCDLGLDRLVEFLTANQRRLIHNSNWCNVVSEQVTNKLRTGIEQWISS